MISHSNFEYYTTPWYSHHDFMAFMEFLRMFFVLTCYFFVLRSYVCKILGLYHVFMYVCRLHRFVLPRFFCLYRLPTYVEPPVFFILRSYVCKILCLYHVLMDVCRLHLFVVPRFFCLHWISTYVESFYSN